MEEYFVLTKQEGIVRGMLRGVQASTAALAIVPMADWLEEPAASRMNTRAWPRATGSGAPTPKADPALAKEMRTMAVRYFRHTDK